MRERNTNIGGVDPIMEVCLEHSWPTESGLVDFSGACEEQLTNAYGDLQVLTIGLVSEDMWQAKALSAW